MQPDSSPSEPEGTPPCPFCEIVAGRAPAEIVRHYSEAVVFVPLNPVTEGHVLVVHRKHIVNIKTSRWELADVMRTAAIHAKPPCNFILSVGAEATQTVPHLHMHVVPRRDGDGLKLPWKSAPEDFNPCRGRCEFHGRLWCKKTGRTCAEYIAEVETSSARA